MDDAALEARLQELWNQIALGSVTQLLDAQYAVPRCAGFPYNWQIDWHDAGANNKQRAIIAANRTGKTRTVAAETAIHLTGRYPGWWRGHRFKKPIVALACAPTHQLVRDVQQKSLFGPMKEGEKIPTGTGWIPANCIGSPSFRQCGISDVMEQIKIRHISGGWSELLFKSYEMGAVKYQGIELDWLWFDEEPDDEKIFSEGLARLVSTGGLLAFSRTPLFGLTLMVAHFMEGGPGIYYVMATWDDAPHLTEENKAAFLSSFPLHERKTRTKGVPMMGTGGVYDVSDDEIAIDPIPLADHWRRIVGVDFGIDHPAAAVWLAHDTDADCVYLYDCYKQSGETAAYHAAALRAKGSWIPVSWPHDGMVRDRGGGVALMEQYRSAGANMLGISARYVDDKGGGQPREPATGEILERMRTHRFKVFNHLQDWFKEKRMLHRVDGKIIAKNDDLESATRYAIMMLRCALSIDASEQKRPTIQVEYDPLAEYSITGRR